jgi:hypothetical protein
MMRMLLATDFSPASAVGQEWLQNLTQHGVREVVLVHAVENPLLDVYSPDTADLDLKVVTGNNLPQLRLTGRGGVRQKSRDDR